MCPRIHCMYVQQCSVIVHLNLSIFLIYYLVNYFPLDCRCVQC